LFIQVCNAVQHAHQKGIIHRDLKPSNIMVTMRDGVPIPKVIDFGIAKATEQRLTDKTLFTSYAQLMGTPAYMSPEQMELSELGLDTRSDIYSLGVLLYELLTGHTAFDTTELLKSGMEELKRTVREREPLSPSAKLQTLNDEELTKTARMRRMEPPRLLTQLHGDLDWIVLKCLENDRTRRYATANALAMDIQCYLHEEAVLARPPSRLYRLQKLVRRNRIAFFSGVAVAAALLMGTVTSTWLYVKERDARRRAVAAEREQASLRHEAELRENVTKAASLVIFEKYAEADKLLGGVALEKPSFEAAGVMRTLGEWHALNGRWRQASERFTTLAKVDRLDNLYIATADQLELGSALVESGDLNGYERFRQESLARFAGTTNPVADRLIKINLLLPANPQMMQSLLPLGEVAEKIYAEVDNRIPWMAAWHALSLALFEYRRGDYAESANWCHRCLAYPDQNASRNATARLILAMSCWRMNQLQEANSEFDEAQMMIETKFKNGLDMGTGADGFWFDWVFARILLRESQQVQSHHEPNRGGKLSEAAYLVSRKQFEEADRLLLEVPAAQPSGDGAKAFRALGTWHALRKKWPEAAARFGSLLKVNQLDTLGVVAFDYLDCGLSLMESGNVAGYDRFRQDAIARFTGTDDKVTAGRILKIILLRPADGKVMDSMTPLAEVAALPFTSADGMTEVNQLRDGWRTVSLSLLEYRRGNYPKAAERSRRGLAYPEQIPARSALAHIVLAMSLHQLGQKDLAHSELEHARDIIESRFQTELAEGSAEQGYWFDWVYARILLREATDLIGGAPKVARGE
jgi:hypothetical protein